jgi:hypothetical protein
MAASKLAAAALAGIAAGAGLVAALAAAPSLAAAPGGGCGATARIEAQWGSGSSGGQIVTVTVTNTSAATSTDWAVTWTLGTGQQLRSAWNAVVSTAGGTVTATNTTWNGRLAAGASTTFGMQLSGLAAAPVPTCDNGGTSPTGSGQTYTVTTTDNLGTVHLTVGDVLVVSLPSNYVPPTVNPAGILSAASVAGGYPTTDPLQARYLATAPGETDIASYTDALCNHQPMPCPSPSDQWRLHVIVG